MEAAIIKFISQLRSVAGPCMTSSLDHIFNSIHDDVHIVNQEAGVRLRSEPGQQSEADKPKVNFTTEEKDKKPK